MTMTEEKKDSNWDVPCSDGEGESDEIPLAVVTLYKSIEEKGVLELRVEEYRRPKVNTPQEECASKESNADQCTNKSPLESIVEPGDEGAQRAPKPALAPSVFDYDDDDQDDDGTGTCQLPRRTPKLGKLNRKRCATLQNVISDLKRFHNLDSKNEEVELEKQQPEQDRSVAHDTESKNPVQESGALH